MGILGQNETEFFLERSSSLSNNHLDLPTAPRR